MTKVLQTLLAFFLPTGIGFDFQKLLPIGNGAIVKIKTFVNDGAIKKADRIVRFHADRVAQVLQAGFIVSRAGSGFRSFKLCGRQIDQQVKRIWLETQSMIQGFDGRLVVPVEQVRLRFLAKKVGIVWSFLQPLLNKGFSFQQCLRAVELRLPVGPFHLNGAIASAGNAQVNCSLLRVSDGNQLLRRAGAQIREEPYTYSQCKRGSQPGIGPLARGEQPDFFTAGTNLGGHIGRGKNDPRSHLCCKGMLPFLGSRFKMLQNIRGRRLTGCGSFQRVHQFFSARWT